MRSRKKRNILNENLRTWVSKDFILNINLRYYYVSKLIGKFPEGKNPKLGETKARPVIVTVTLCDNMSQKAKTCKILFYNGYTYLPLAT